VKQRSRWEGVAALIGFVGVGLGAFGAHAVKGFVEPAMLEVWKTATLYLFVHVFAAFQANQVSPRIAAMFSLGTLVFSGSLYAMVITNLKVLGAITPIGGVIYLIAWGALAYTYLRKRHD